MRFTRTCVLVLGMHRSGTSAFTRVLNLLGLPLGAPLLEPTEGNNEAGFWELAPLVALNERILDCLRVPWDSPGRLPDDWLQSVPAPMFAKAAAIVEGNFRAAAAFVVKDPRMCRLWPFWVRVLEESGVRPIAMHVLRSPGEVAGSLKARDGLSLERGTALWLRYTLEAEALRAPRLLVEYDTLMREPQAAIASWCAWLAQYGVSASLAGNNEILASLRPSLRHFTGDPPPQTEVGAEAASLHAYLVAGARSGGVPLANRSPRASVETIDRWLAGAGAYEAGQVPRLVDKLAVETRTAVLTEQHVQNLAAQAQMTQRTLAEREAALNAQVGEIAQERAELRRRADRLHSELAQSRTKLEAADTAHRCAQETLDGLQRMKALTDQHVQNLEAFLADRDGALAAIRRSLLWRLSNPLRLAAKVARMAMFWVGARRIVLFPRPVHQLVMCGGGSFRSTGDDPWFVLDAQRGELRAGWPAGWYDVEIGAASAGCEFAHKLYPDYGGGYAEAAAITLPQDVASGRRAHVRLRRHARSMRLDPLNGPGEFTLGGVRVRRIPGFVALITIVVPAAARVLTQKGFDRKRLAKLVSLWRAGGVAAVVDRLRDGADGERNFEYWVGLYDAITEKRLAGYRAAGEALPERPLISILVPAYNTPEAWLRKCIESVLAQTYDRWELCIVDDASTDPAVGRVLAEYAARDARIRCERLGTNRHIAGATNRALELATGSLVTMLDHDDELAPWALYWLASTLAEHPDAVMIYSDEDKIDEAGRRFEPYFKPDWNPLLLYAQNYVCHLVAYRRDAVVAAGGFREGFEGAQDWDLALRVSERCDARQVRHVPRILYHWRSVAGSTARHADEKMYAGTAGHRAVVEALARANVRADVVRLPEGYHRIAYAMPEPPPSVSILIPTRNGVELVRNCMTSLRTTTYPDFEVLLIDNQSDDPEALAYFRSLAEAGDARVIPYDRPFNFSAINNFAAREARGDILVFLNNDVEVIEPGWLTELVSLAVRPDVGAVGAKLLYPDRTIQHAGVVVGFGGVAGHIGLRESRDFRGQMSRCRIAQNIGAVTAACLAVRKSAFEAAGGFDEEFLRIAFNDIDLCLKLGALGLRNVWTPHAELVHHESASRGLENTPEKQARFNREVEHMIRKWGEKLRNDAAYNPNLDLARQTFALAYPPRVAHAAD